MKHKTFPKEKEKNLKRIIKAQKDEIARLEKEIKQLQAPVASEPKKVKTKSVSEKPKPSVEPVKSTSLRPKSQKQWSDEERKAFCTEFSRRFKQSKEEDVGTD